MKKVIIFHGTSGYPEQFWFPYIKENLSQELYEVIIPQLPNPDTPILHDWLSFASSEFSYDADTILI